MEKAIKIIGRLLIIAFMVVVVVITIYPVLFAITGSFKTNMELLLGEKLLPEKWLFENYVYAFKQAKFIDYTMNSVFLCTMTTILSILTSSMAGFCMARYNFPGRSFLNALYLMLMFISVGATALYPVYMLMNSLGLNEGLIGLALVLTGGQAANIFLVTGFVRSTPKELDESAMIDGCSPFKIYWKIILPLIRPIIAVVGLFAFRATWNDYVTSMVFTMSKRELQPLTVAVVGLRYSVNAAAEWHIMAAGASIALLPMIVVYTLASKQFISGLTLGAVKG